MTANKNALVLVDLCDRELGTAEKTDVHRRGLLHRAFSVFLFDGSRILLQRRAAEKYHSGGLWTNTCCSHACPGEALSVTAVRRLQEECGITAVLQEVGSFAYRTVFDNGLTEYEYDHVFVGCWRGEPVPDPSEIQQMRYMDVDELVRDITSEPGKYTAWLPGALKIALEHRPAQR